MLRFGWVGLAGLVASLAALPGPTARAAPSPSPAPKNKVYLDPDSLHFNAPLRQGEDQTIEIFTLLPPGSDASITYFPVYHRGTPCPDGGSKMELTAEQAAKARVRTFVPGTKGDGGQRYTTFIGPLSMNVRYCFRLAVQQPHELDEQEKRAFARAFQGALSAATTWATKGSYPHAEACEMPAKGPRPPTSCELAVELETQLGWKETKLELALPGESKARPFRQGFEALWTRDELFRRIVVGMFIDLEAVEELTTRYREVHDELRTLKTVDLRYDPLPAVTLEVLRRAARRRPPVNKELKALSKALEGKDPKSLEARKALVSWVQKLGPELRKPLLAKLKGDAKAQVETYYEGPSSARNLPFEVDPSSHQQRISALEPLLGVTVLGSRTATEVSALPPLEEIVKARGIAGSEAQRALKYVGLVVELMEQASAASETKVTQSKTLERSLDALLGKATKGKDDPSHLIYEAFLSKLVALRHLEKDGRFTYEPGFEDRFPLYATGEFGVAAVVVAVDNDDSRDLDVARSDFITYFGVNFYFTALDKEEPLTRAPKGLSENERNAYRNRNFLRRFSVMAGMSVVNEPSNGLKGVIGNQYALFGAGLRFTDHLRLSGGTVLLRYSSPNPLSSRSPVAAMPYVSIGLDADVLGTVKRWHKKLTSSNE